MKNVFSPIHSVFNYFILIVINIFKKKKGFSHPQINLISVFEHYHLDT